MDFPGLLLAALLCAEVAVVGLAVRAAAQKTSGPDCSEPLWHFHRNSQVRCRCSRGVPAESCSSDERASDVRRPYLLSQGVRWGAARMRRAWAIVTTPLVLLLSFALADELACLALHAALDGAPRPLAGWYRAGWHVSIALSLGWPAVLVLATWGRPWRRLDPLHGAYLGALAGLAIVYPPSRAGLRWTLLTWELACVALAWWGLWRARLRTWGAVEVCLVVLVACESAVCLVGPFASDPFTRWWIARCFYLGAWLAVIGTLIKANRAR